MFKFLVCLFACLQYIDPRDLSEGGRESAFDIDRLDGSGQVVVENGEAQTVIPGLISIKYLAIESFLFFFFATLFCLT